MSGLEGDGATVALHVGGAGSPDGGSGNKWSGHGKHICCHDLELKKGGSFRSMGLDCFVDMKTSLGQLDLTMGL